jgi:hypothetical protein
MRPKELIGSAGTTERIIKMRCGGLRSRDIAPILDLPVSAVERVLRDVAEGELSVWSGNEKPKRKAHGFWNEQTEADLVTYWRAGFSASEIGEKMGTSRSSILGKADRMQLPARRGGRRRPYPHTQEERQELKENGGHYAPR